MLVSSMRMTAVLVVVRSAQHFWTHVCRASLARLQFTGYKCNMLSRYGLITHFCQSGAATCQSPCDRAAYLVWR
uniref:Uncharacterized protein n=1 Tax=Eimeria tenella TaxID=5802 RepID=H9B9U0_EIMTE|nr:hypothetical protein [Eimeria tenella]